MAATTPPAPQVSTIDAAAAAIEHTRRNLFPFRFQKWLVLGFLAFVDQCGRSWNGGPPGGGGHGGGGGGGWPRNGEEMGRELSRGVESALTWLGAHTVEVVIGAIVGIALIGFLVALVMWINSHGTFMYLDNVASGRADIARAWREHFRAADSYFVWRLALGLATFAIFLFGASLLAVGVVAFARGRLEGASGAVLLAALLPVFLVLFVALPLLALAGIALRDFVAPLQLVTGLPCAQAARILEGLVTAHPGAFLLYLLLKLFAVVVTGAAVVIVGFLTCCIGFLPVVMQTLLQPLFFFERSFPLFLLKQLGHDLPGRFTG